MFEGNVVKISARRQRTQFSVEQLEILESVFVETHYPDNKLRKRIAKDTGLADERIQVCSFLGPFCSSAIIILFFLISGLVRTV